MTGRCDGRADGPSALAGSGPPSPLSLRFSRGNPVPPLFGAGAVGAVGAGLSGVVAVAGGDGAYGRGLLGFLTLPQSTRLNLEPQNLHFKQPS